MNQYNTKGSCYKCTDRKAGCHIKCERYKEFDEANKRRREAILKAHLENSEMISYKLEKVKRTKR